MKEKTANKQTNEKKIPFSVPWYILCAKTCGNISLHAIFGCTLYAIFVSHKPRILQNIHFFFARTHGIAFLFYIILSILLSSGKQALYSFAFKFRCVSLSLSLFVHPFISNVLWSYWTFIKKIMTSIVSIF